MEELLRRFAQEFVDADGWIRILNAGWIEDTLDLELEILFYPEAELETWHLSCSGVVKASVSFEGTEILGLALESPLLKPYTEPEVDLMFSENECTPAFLLGVVCSSCVELFGTAAYVSDFMNQKATINGIVSSRYGLLGRFPESVATRILEFLKDQPISINALEGRPPRRRDGQKFVGYPPLKVLEIGSSYVIAEQFSARQQ